MPLAADGPDSKARISALADTLQRLGWEEGRNIRFDYRWSEGNAELARKYAAELVALKPDVIVASGGSVVGPLLQVTRAIPIVFLQTPDPVGAGFVSSLAQPGGNATGFTQFEFSLSLKWLELLKQMAPGLANVGVLRDKFDRSGVGQWEAMQGTAASFKVDLSPIDVGDAGSIENSITETARKPNSGLIITASAPTSVHRNLIVTLAARNALPAVYPFRFFVTAGGLVCYGPELLDPYRRTAGYVDRILKDENPANLPVQAPTKYELVINLKTAKALGLEISPTLLARADEVIE